VTKEEGKEKTRGFVIAVPEICILEKKKKNQYGKKSGSILSSLIFICFSSEVF